MIKLYTNEQKPQTAVLVGVNTSAYDADESIDELKELAVSAGAYVAATVLQNLQSINNATYVGMGKLYEIKDICLQSEADIAIFDDELTGTQIRNIEKVLDIRVVDRTTLILDIFAQRAISKEGKLQVELAQQKYLLPRLIGLGNSLSRQGGGIGTRGPGETKLESDRRHIRRRIEVLTNELRELEKRRERVRLRRNKNDALTVAIIGYTNAGKSTLLNLLTNAGVLEEDKLFATLDPTARELKLKSGQKIILIDTVGFIRRLPHKLIEAFKSTLEEASSADLILNVCDVSDKDFESKLNVTKALMGELNCLSIPTITVYNKADLMDRIPHSDNLNRVYISAKTGYGIENLLNAVEKNLEKFTKTLTLLIPYNNGTLSDKIRKSGNVIEESYENDGIKIKASVDVKMIKELEEYII